MHPKVKAVGLAGTLTTILLAVAAALHVQLSEAVAAAIATVVVTIAGYYAPAKS